MPRDGINQPAFVDEAKTHDFIPEDLTNWSPDRPDDVHEALRLLVARVAALEAPAAGGSGELIGILGLTYP